MNLEPTEEQRQIVATVRRFVREEIVPLEAKLDPDASELPPEDFARLTETGARHGLLRPRHSRRVRRRRRRPRHTHAHGRRDGAAPRRPLRALLRRVRLGGPRPALRGQRGPEAALSLSDAARREARLLRPHRAVGRQRSRPRHPHPRRQGRQRLGHQRLQGVHLRRRPRPLRPRVRAHGRREGPRRHHLLHRRHRHEGLPRAPRRAHAALLPLRHRAAVRGPARARRPTCWARSARGSPSPTTACRASASPMRQPASASPSRRRSWPSSTPSSARPSARRSPRARRSSG